MPRAVRYHPGFSQDLDDRLDWLVEHRPVEQVTNVRLALARFVSLVGRNPAIGREVERRGNRSYRIFPIGGRLPYLVGYYFDVGTRNAPIWLVMLSHEAQDRERFNPERFD